VLAGHSGWLAWLAASPVLALPLVPRLVRAVPAGASSPGTGSRRAALAALAPSAVLLVVTLAGGALVTFLPIERPDGALATAALLAFGVTGALTRWRAGILADRVGHRLLLPGAVLVGAAGLALVAAGLHASDALLLVGAAVFGAGFGATQNLTLLAAFGRAGDSGTTTASALWNASFDAGTAVGALVPGFVAVAVGLPWTYAIVAAVLVAALPVARASTRLS
jgi:predicted MFS family arabinose efflux permease